jgi:hypothetical protein
MQYIIHNDLRTYKQYAVKIKYENSLAKRRRTRGPARNCAAQCTLRCVVARRRAGRAFQITAAHYNCLISLE